MSETVNNSTGGIGFLGVLAILFIALKLTGYITWSWVWVLAPIWVPILLTVGIVIGIAIYVGTRENK